MQVVMFNGHKMVVVVLCVLSFVNTFFLLLSHVVSLCWIAACICLNVTDRSGALLSNCTSALNYLCKARPKYLVPHCSIIESFLSTKWTV